jgi:hypothetical protein
MPLSRDALFLERRADLFRAIIGGRGADHLRALPPQFKRDGLPDAAAGAGDQRNLSFQDHVSPFFTETIFWPPGCHTPRADIQKFCHFPRPCVKSRCFICG